MTEAIEVEKKVQVPTGLYRHCLGCKALMLTHELDENQWIQSKRLLSATDRIKYARRGGGTALFEALDQDFRELISTTRWRLEPKEDADD